MLNPLKTGAAALLGSSVLALGAITAIGSVTTDVAYAQDEDRPVEGRQFSAAAGEKVNEALVAINADNPRSAVNILNTLLNSGATLNPYERSIIYQMLGQSYNDLDDTSASLRAFQQAIDSGGLLPNEAQQIELAIAQLMIADEQFVAGAQKLEELLRRGVREDENLVNLLVSAWVGAERYSNALPWAEKWFNAASPKEKKHFDLLNFLYNNLGMPDKQADIVKQMIERWPEDRSNWNNWVGLLANGGREEDAFEVNKMLYLGGALTEEDDILKLVRYYSFYEMPYQAAEIMRREMDAGRVTRTPRNLEDLSNHYRTAREYEKAIPILEQAANQAGSAALYAALGEAYYNEGQCQNAETAFNQAINRGYDAGKSWMQVANCRYDSTQTASRLDCSNYDFENYEEKRAAITSEINQAPISRIRASAIDAFRKVPSGSRESRNARKWIDFVENERQAFVDRCLFEINVDKELCFSKIKLEYDNLAFAGGEFELSEEDAHCMKYKDEYDATYVRVTSE